MCKKVDEIIKNFEQFALEGILSEKCFEEILAFEAKVNAEKETSIIYALGRYFKDRPPQKTDFHVFWVHLFRRLSQNDRFKYSATMPRNSLVFYSWKRWAVNCYIRRWQEYKDELMAAEEYMNGFASGSLRYNNSAHRSEAISKYERALAQAEKLLDDGETQKIEKKIHFLNAG